MKRSISILALLTLLGFLPAQAFAAPSIMPSIDWSAIARALRNALSSWQSPPPPSPTPTPRGTSTYTPTRTRTPSFTRTASATPTPFVQGNGQISLGLATGLPPAQKLESALLIFPYVEARGTLDTRITLVNMSTSDIELQCFWVRQIDNSFGCTEFEVGFFMRLTAEQPLSFLASEGTNNPLTFTAVPPLDGVGELKCAVVPDRPQVNFHNVIQGRAIVFDTSNGETVGYGAVGFQRLADGDFSGVVDLGGTYDSCPDRLHFQVLAGNGVNSTLVLIPCGQDLLTQTFTSTPVQLLIINEFEQVFSASYTSTCRTRIRSFSSFGTLRFGVLGTDTAHLIVRGVSSPLIGLVIDRFDAFGQRQTTVNEPFLEGGREATIIFP